jgi:hypothetical protein
MGPRRSTTLSADERRRLMGRIDDLELRLKLLEARVRRDSAERRSGRRVAVNGPVAKVARQSKPLPRCAGCTLELPKGFKGVECVWCGFRFDADRLFKDSPR